MRKHLEHDEFIIQDTSRRKGVLITLSAKERKGQISGRMGLTYIYIYIYTFVRTRRQTSRINFIIKIN